MTSQYSINCLHDDDINPDSEGPVVIIGGGTAGTPHTQQAMILAM